MKENSDTPIYFQFNFVFANILITMEIIYCLICMALFLFIIYWSQAEKKDIILGKDAEYSSGDDAFDDDY